jgi:S1-C subfamily serine protease
VKSLSNFILVTAISLVMMGCCHHMHDKVSITVTPPQAQINPQDLIGSVVMLKIERIDEPGSGLVATGFAISEDYIMSAGHFCGAAVEGPLMPLVHENVNIHFLNDKDEEYYYPDGEIVAVDEQKDLCLVKREGHGLTPLEIARPYLDTIRVGDRAYTIGAPAGFFPSITEGYVVQLKTNLPGYPMLDNSILLSLAAFHGNSGGPIINSEGKVIGVMKAIMTSYVHVSFGVTVEDMLTFLKENE